MAKLHNYYVLCPLIDQKSFLGVSPDQDSENVIVTLCRNVVNKYRLSDQNQVGGWNSKDHITAPVIYDSEQSRYVGVFNNNTIKIWSDDSENLDKIKKYKFPINILKLVPRGEKSPLIIFSNGNCASLPYALENRKAYANKSLIKENETIVDMACYSINNADHVCYIIKSSKDQYDIINCSIREELGDLERVKLSRTKISRLDDVYVVGKLISITDRNLVYVLWSDSKITVYDLFTKSLRTIGTVPWISTFSSVSMAWMGKNHLILFGSNIDQDGAIIVAYNVVLGVGSCKYPMKMYTDDSRIYCINDRIILEASNHVGMLPYVLETKRNLSSLLGSHEVIENECTEIADWGASTKPYKVFEEGKDLWKLGLSERTVCAQVIPPLVEKRNFKKIKQTIKQFKDIPEPTLALLLKYALNLVNSSSIDVTNTEELAKVLYKEQEVQFLNHILGIPFCDALFIPYLRNGLNLDEALFLMSYISYMLVESETSIGMEMESRLFDWCTLLMDSFYQQYLMTKDEKVSFVLKNLLKTIDSLVNQISTIDSMLPLMHKVLSGKASNVEDTSSMLSYSIEIMQI